MITILYKYNNITLIITSIIMIIYNHNNKYMTCKI